MREGRDGRGEEVREGKGWERGRGERGEGVGEGSDGRGKGVGGREGVGEEPKWLARHLRHTSD